MPNQSLHTSRLILRRWKQSDIVPFAAMCSDPRVMQYIGNGSTKTFDQASRTIEAFEREWDSAGYGLFAVEEQQTGDLLGFTGLSSPNFLPEILPSVEIGWRFSFQSWGKGYATEAATAALSFGVNQIGLDDIVSIYQMGNAASPRIMHKIGMILERQTIDPTCNREIEVYRLPPASA